MNLTELHNFSTFLKNSPTAFHAVDSIEKLLKAHGFSRLNEGDRWELLPGGNYFVTRNASSIIAFSIGEQVADAYSFHISASHSDSPSFRLKENARIAVKDAYTTLNTEGYGGMLCSTWFDRPLSIAGRVLVQDGTTLLTKLVNIDRDLLMIPSLAIHLNREANEKQSFNKQKDLLPLLANRPLDADVVKQLLAAELGVDAASILGSDLYLYNRDEPKIWGFENEFFSGPRLDDLQCAYGSLVGFLEGSHPAGINVYACFDNEEVGSGTKQGAASTFLFDTLSRINDALGKEKEDLHRAFANSFLLSCDNGHALHPNYPEKTDATNYVLLNKGLVVKSHAGQKYTSDATSIALFSLLCQKAGVPLQHFSNRSDMVGGSTLGNIAMSQVSVNAIDIGLPQLAMHSAYETSGTKDLSYLIAACKALYSCHIEQTETGSYAIK